MPLRRQKTFFENFYFHLMTKIPTAIMLEEGGGGMALMARKEFFIIKLLIAYTVIKNMIKINNINSKLSNKIIFSERLYVP